ncbi:MAG: DEAD/DEAH box helicase family protein [Zoogloeaceae bacterium]|jgi:superfamily II DNA or RNA helicase|nr:DEAD/DEAH box helicase family protein [Zoogloeaceae bacterium]
MKSPARRRASSGTKSRTRKEEAKFSRTVAPEGISPVDWQRALRRQFGREQAFGWKNLGEEPIFSDFLVSNPHSQISYRVAIRGSRPGENHCTCPDYATNALGTCKHIEFVLAQLEKKRGAKKAFAQGFQPPFSELLLRYDDSDSDSQRGPRLHFRAGLDCPPDLRAAAADLFDDNGAMAFEKLDVLPDFLTLAAQRGHTVRAHGDALDFVASRRDAKWRARRIDALFPQGNTETHLKDCLKIPLYPYQVEGALFAARAGRVLIGDEMGLGKTIQAIAAAEILARYFGISKVLVVCPTSLKYQWQSEIRRFAGREARVMAGNLAQRRKDYAEDDFCKITNYEKLKPDIDPITAWAPDLVIVDEAQRIKNWNTIAARALKRIDSPYAFVLTGTPLENKLEELISVIQFVDPYRLGPTWKLLHDHQLKNESGRVVGYTGLARIGAILAPVMIRRRKSEVLAQLPERTDQNLLVPMTEMQISHHHENAEIVVRIVNRWRKMKYLSDQDQRRLTCALQSMQMSCDSSYLLDQESDHGVKADELAALLDGLLEQPEAKVVAFSQWTRMHEVVIRRLVARGIGYVSFHGGVPAEKRPALLERFQNDPACRVFLSTDAGATGLNLQHASTLVNLDLPWNPAVLEQRAGRIHRMGQKRPVRIINFVAKGSIEEGILSVLAFKRSLSAGILDGGAGEISLGGSRLARFMKDVENVTARMGESEAMPADEEAVPAVRADPRLPPMAADEAFDAPEVWAEALGEKAPESQIAPPAAPETVQPAADPWLALAQVGTQLASALAAGSRPDAPAHPWIERDPATGLSSLRLPLPPPETARRLADTLQIFAEAPRGRGG